MTLFLVALNGDPTVIRIQARVALGGMAMDATGTGDAARTPAPAPASGTWA